jgi:hypothetical protein
VSEGKTAGVQKLPLQARWSVFAAVLHVAGDRVAYRGHVHANLVRAPGLDADIEQSKFAESAIEPPNYFKM